MSWRSVLPCVVLVLAACSQPEAGPDSGPDGAAGSSFDTVYAVLTHPRCLNCHPAGDRPLQFEDSRQHAMNVQRGEEDRGVPGMMCAGCHGPGNQDGPHLPPGAAVWHLAPKTMVFEGKSPRELAQGLKTGPMSLEDMIEHVEHDPLVGWGWDPGPGREPVPTSRDAFVAAFKAWVEAGAPLPEEDR